MKTGKISVSLFLVSPKISIFSRILVKLPFLVEIKCNTEVKRNSIKLADYYKLIPE
jgi:hypothetical protein